MKRGENGGRGTGKGRGDARGEETREKKIAMDEKEVNVWL